MVCAGIFVSIFFAACGPSEIQTIGKNVDPDVTKLEEVKTFSWTTNIDKIPNEKVFLTADGLYVYNNESTRKKIKDAIKYELQARGYKMRKVNDAGMLVSFLVLEQADSLRTTQGYVMLDGEPVISEEDVSWTPVEPGTLIISLVDKKSEKMVWQGFASGIIKPADINDEAKIRQAVSSIFSKFRYDALNG